MADLSEGGSPHPQDDIDVRRLSKKSKPFPVADIPVGRIAEFYNTNNKKRGQAIIFNHKDFGGKLPTRSGTELDGSRLTEQLERLGFTVEEYMDPNSSKIKEIVDKAAQDDHSESDCFLMAVLSHGERDLLYTKDGGYKPDTLWTPFTADRCKSLAGKPKLFFIQACQGDKFDSGVILRRTETDASISPQYPILIHADFVIAYSTIPGYFSWRNAIKGSWFVQALCQELHDRGDQIDLLTLLTSVNQRVALNFESNVPTDERMNKKKQIPCVMSTLTHRLILAGNKEVQNVAR